ncbi:hypothetical protein Tco_0754436 [Tanacetum coccineum]
MAELISKEYMEKAQTESNLFNTSNDINIELNKEFLIELQKNAYHGMLHEDVVDHIAKVLEMLDLINIPGMDSHQLRMKVFPLSLTDDGRQWWINEGEGKITVWEELVEKIFCKFCLESYDGEEEIWNKRRMDDNILSSNNTTTDSFFKHYLKTRKKNDTEKEDEQIQMKRKCGDTSNSINEQPNKRMCKAENFKALKYSLGPNE